MRACVCACVRVCVRVCVHTNLVVAVVGLRLSQLVVVVRELEIRATGVDVHVRTEDVTGHDRALDVPARPPRPPWRFPRLRVDMPKQCRAVLSSGSSYVKQ